MSDDEYANWSARGRAPAGDESTLRDHLTADDPGVRRDAALGLVDASTDGLDEATVARLAERVEADADPDVRQFAAEALGAAGAPAATVAPALTDADEWVRAEGVVALSRAAARRDDGGDVDVGERLRAALDDDSGAVRRNAVIALAKTGRVDPGTLRDRLKRDSHAGVREYAARYLADDPGQTDESVTLLAAVLARDREALVRAAAATSLGELGTDRAVEALESQGVTDRSQDVVRAARRAVAVARGEDPEDVELPSAAPGGGPDRPSETLGTASGTTGGLRGGVDGGLRGGSGGPPDGTGGPGHLADRGPRGGEHR
ncbi:HEAT repeat domain-containing protein [Halorubrum rutilum]|uniref:HEAT repeat domain-containing protein n=1 Tax=Halorubrum rutilum TaxID=1364933 RepID=A0ABD6AGQ5_9EURY|nr:HEAT repeat domain-containing protein [Halorubrum rutilum]